MTVQSYLIHAGCGQLVLLCESPTQAPGLQPARVEFKVGVGIAAMGAFALSALAKVAIAIEASRPRA